MPGKICTNKMTRHLKNVLLIGLFIYLICSSASAAPLPPFEPVNITGTIMMKEWFPETRVKGIPGMSGSAGRDRTFPSHFKVILENYEGIDTATARRINFLLGFSNGCSEPSEKPKHLLLKLPHQDKFFLDQAVRIRVRGYKITGDEGGTWTSYEKIEILSKQKSR